MKKTEEELQKKRIYVAYGSNLNQAQMQYRCPSAVVIGSGFIEDYELVFRGSKTGSYATIEPCQGECVPVLLWRITPEDEQALDRYEGYPSFYQKEMVAVYCEETDVNAMAYVMPTSHALGMPSNHYVNTIAEGYGQAGFDVERLYEAVDATKMRLEQEEEPCVVEENCMGFDWC